MLNGEKPTGGLGVPRLAEGTVKTSPTVYPEPALIMVTDCTPYVNVVVVTPVAIFRNTFGEPTGPTTMVAVAPVPVPPDKGTTYVPDVYC
jgi:hypothetical protein